MQVLAKAMTLRLKKHAAISGNLANADTPGYRPKQLEFEDQLQRAVRSNDISSLQRIEGSTRIVDDKVPRLDGNSVSVDKQMASLTENSTVYQATAEFLKKKVGMLKRVIG